MKALIRVVGARQAVLPSIAHASSALWEVVGSLRRLLPRDARWFVLTSGYRRVALHDMARLNKVLSSSGPKRQSDIVPGQPTHRSTVVATRQGSDVAHLSLAFSMAQHTGPAGVVTELNLGQRAFERPPEALRLAQEALVAIVRSFALEAGRATPGDVADPSTLPHRARVGWLTFLPERLGPLPPLPPGCGVDRLEHRGWILRAFPELPERQAPEYLEALAHLRYALGARVLQDGPAFPPRVEEPAEPHPTPPALVPAPQAPSYLKTPTATPAPAGSPAAARPALAPSSPHPLPARQAPTSSETSDIDVSAILKNPLPFDPKAPSAPVAQVSPKQTAPVAAGETGPVDVFAARKAPVPFKPITQRESGNEASPPALAPGMAMTAAINLGLLLQRAVPFGAAGSEPATSPVSAAESALVVVKPEKPAPSGFGETEEINLASLLKQGSPVPFASVTESSQVTARGSNSAPEPRPAMASNPAPVPAAVQPVSLAGHTGLTRAPSARGHWIRFDGQTGQPLATPRWEEYPGPEKK